MLQRRNYLMSEAFQPIAFRPPSENRMIFWLMSLVDLQLLTIFRFLRLPLCSYRGRLLNVGPGESPWRDLLPQGEFIGFDADMSRKFECGISQPLLAMTEKGCPMTTTVSITYYSQKCWNTLLIPGSSLPTCRVSCLREEL